MPFAAALSGHPDSAMAVGELVGQALDMMGGEPSPDLAVLFATTHHLPAFADVAGTVREVLRPGTLVGCSASSVLANGSEVEDGPAMTLWVGRFGSVHPVRLGVGPPAPADPPFEPTALFLAADPFSFPAEPAFDAIAQRWPGLPVIGGMASASNRPGGNRLLLDQEVATTGAVGAFVGPGLDVQAIVSQGCRPIGQLYAVTAAEENVVRELAGRPAMQRLIELAKDRLNEEEIAAINSGGLHVGRVIDEHKVDFAPGDFLVRNVVGANQTEGWIALGEPVEVGTTLQYHLRDADSADDDLRALLNGRTADAALVFTCNGRGRNLFGEPDHDAGVVAEYLGRPPVAGMFCAGEFGPVGGANFVHGFTASIALLREVDPPIEPREPAGRVAP